MAEEIVTAGLGLSFDVFDADDFDRTLTRLMRLDAAGLQEMSQRGFSGPVRLGQTEAAWVSQLVRLYQSALPGEAPQAARVTG
jgi:hypothetical protein